jgi:hypothetical protein
LPVELDDAADGRWLALALDKLVAGRLRDEEAVAGLCGHERGDLRWFAVEAVWVDRSFQTDAVWSPAS